MPDLVPLTRRCARCATTGAPPERVGECRELIHYQVRGTASEEIAGLRTMLATVTAERDQARADLVVFTVAARFSAQMASVQNAARTSPEQLQALRQAVMRLGKDVAAGRPGKTHMTGVVDEERERG